MLIVKLISSSWLLLCFVNPFPVDIYLSDLREQLAARRIKDNYEYETRRRYESSEEYISKSIEEDTSPKSFISFQKKGLLSGRLEIHPTLFPNWVMNKFSTLWGSSPKSSKVKEAPVIPNEMEEINLPEAKIESEPDEDEKLSINSKDQSENEVEAEDDTENKDADSEPVENNEDEPRENSEEITPIERNYEAEDDQQKHQSPENQDISDKNESKQNIDNIFTEKDRSDKSEVHDLDNEEEFETAEVEFDSKDNEELGEIFSSEKEKEPEEVNIEIVESESDKNDVQDIFIDTPNPDNKKIDEEPKTETPPPRSYASYVPTYETFSNYYGYVGPALNVASHFFPGIGQIKQVKFGIDMVNSVWKAASMYSKGDMGLFSFASFLGTEAVKNFGKRNEDETLALMENATIFIDTSSMDTETFLYLIQNSQYPLLQEDEELEIKNTVTEMVDKHFHENFRNEEEREKFIELMILSVKFIALHAFIPSINQVMS